MKKSLMFLLVLLCMASLVAGMAYSMVNVTTESTIALSAADDAILAFKVIEDADGTFSDKNNKIAMNFQSGNNSHGIQANADYTYEKNLIITNNSADTVRVTILDQSGKGELMATKAVEMSIYNLEEKVYFAQANKLGDKMTMHQGFTDGVVLVEGQEIELTINLRGQNAEGDMESVKADIIFRAVPVQ